MAHKSYPANFIPEKAIVKNLFFFLLLWGEGVKLEHAQKCLLLDLHSGIIPGKD